MSAWRHARAVLFLPIVVTGIVPLAIVWWSGIDVGWGADGAIVVVPVLLGLALLCAGVVLVVWTIRLFVTIGGGTLAPWDPTSTLVSVGPYRHVRNPMISGVVCVLAGEALLLGSTALALWCIAVAAVNAVYIPLVEEPGLRRRFGESYGVYCSNVPRWLPRVRPWIP